MTIENRMTKNPITATPEMPIQTASSLMKDNGIHCLPVVEKDGRLVGIISDKDILKAAPSPASTLSVFEMNFLLSNLTVKKIMARNPITITTGTTISEAATIMIDQDISWLPVMEDKNLVGIVSKTDLLKMLAETIGAREHGTTVTFVVTDKKGVIASISTELSQKNISLISCSVFRGTNDSTKTLTMKAKGCSRSEFVDIIKPYATEILDAQEN